MKKLLLLLLALIIFTTGCTRDEPISKPIDNMPINIVENYVKASSNCDWDVALTMLSGEALQEAQANKDRITSTQKVISIQTQVKQQTDNYAIVLAEVIKTNNFDDITFNDITAYEFKLQKVAGQWYIYKVLTTDIKQPELKNGVIPEAARDKIIKYLEASLSEKYEKDYLYLAGFALTNSLKYKNTVPKEQPIPRVLDIYPIGVSDKYIVLKAIYSVETTGYKPITMTAMIDMVNVAGEWKIVQLDIAQIANE